MTIENMFLYGIAPILGVPVFGPIYATCFALTKEFSRGPKTLVYIGRISGVILFSCIASFMITGLGVVICCPFMTNNIVIKMFLFLAQMAFFAEFGSRALAGAGFNPWILSKEKDGIFIWLMVQPFKLVIPLDAAEQIKTHRLFDNYLIPR